MTRLFSVQDLRPDEAARAYPLVQSAMPGLNLARWTGFVRGITKARSRGAERRSGIMTIRSDRGYIHGLFSYTVAPNLRHGRVLLVDNFVALDLIDPELPAKALGKVMESVALHFDCQAIYLNVADGGAPSTIVPELGRPFSGHDRRFESICYFRDEAKTAYA